MRLLTPALVGLVLSLTVVPGPVAAHSSGGPGWGGYYGMPYGGMMNPGNFSDEYLDQLGEAMAERFQSMQKIAGEKDPDARRKLVRKHLENMFSYAGGRRGNAGKQNQGGQPGWMMGRGMMGYGPGARGYGPGMMGYGPGMMGYGMGPGMMYPGQMSDEYLDLLGEHMAEQYDRMARIAGTSDKAERRTLIREQFEDMQEFMESMHHGQ